MKDKWQKYWITGLALLLMIGAAGLYLERPGRKLEITVQPDTSSSVMTVAEPVTSAAVTTTAVLQTTHTTASETETGTVPTAPPEHDLNRASADDLMRVDGIGEALSAAIISARDARGGFTARSQLCEIDGIGQVLMERIMGEFEIPGEISEPEHPEPETEFTEPGAEQPADDTYYINVYEVNSVTREQLMTIPEMTVEKADAILAMRSNLKQFHGIYEVSLAEGISGEYFERVLMHHLYVEGDPNSIIPDTN